VILVPQKIDVLYDDLRGEVHLLQVTKRMTFAMSHRLTGSYAGACQNIHGHNYTLDVTLRSMWLNDNGMIVDFAKIKAHIGSWINQHLDHHTLVRNTDHELKGFLKAQGSEMTEVPFNPTAEGMVLWLSGVLQRVLDDQVAEKGRIVLQHIRLYETDTSWADWERDA